MEPVYRVATTEDKPGIMSIGDVYDGLDYLEYFIDYYLGDANYRNVVAVVDGTVVGFSMAMLFDGGQSVVSRATRVSKDWRGRAVAKGLVTTAIDLIKTGETKFEILTVDNTNDVYSKPGKEEYVNIAERDIFSYHLTKTPRSPARKRSVIKTLTIPMLQEILSDNASCDKLFPRKLLFFGGVAFELLPQNADKILTEITEGFCSYEPGAETCSVITMRSKYVCPNGYVYLMVVYGNDSQSIEDHFRSHIEWAHECANHDLPADRKKAPIFLIIFSDVNTANVVTSTMQTIGIDLSSMKYNRDTVFRRML